MFKDLPNPITIMDSVGDGVVSAMKFFPNAANRAIDAAATAGKNVLSDAGSFLHTPPSGVPSQLIRTVMNVPSRAIAMGKLSLNVVVGPGTDSIKGVKASIERGIREVTRIF